MNTLAFLCILPIMGSGVLGGKYYDTLNGVTYYIETMSQFNWFEAYFECHYRNMTLYTYESQAQFDDLYQLLTSNKFTDTGKPPNVWLGAVGLKGKFVWIKTQQPMTAHHLWSEGNPDNYADKEHCLHIWNNKQILNDWDCMHKTGFVCEMNARSCQVDGTHTKTDGENSGGPQTGKYKGFIINLYQTNAPK